MHIEDNKAFFTAEDRSVLGTKRYDPVMDVDKVNVMRIKDIISLRHHILDRFTTPEYEATSDQLEAAEHERQRVQRETLVAGRVMRQIIIYRNPDTPDIDELD